MINLTTGMGMTIYRALCTELALVLAEEGAPATQPVPAPALVPVPVSERLPQPEDCNGEGKCWWFSPPACGPHEIRPCWTFDLETLEGDTHWLPHWALPLPAKPEASDG
jgi:hypothetical protein